MTRRSLFGFPRRSRGAGLLEVMVAAAILGLGLIGVAALQMAALQGSSAAQHRARATDLAASLADRIRANITEDNSYVTAVAANCNAPTRCASTPDGATTAGACTQADVATYDLWEVRCQNGIRDSLPGGTLTVACTDSDTTDGDACTAGSLFAITVAWQGLNDTDAADSTVVFNFVPGGE